MSCPFDKEKLTGYFDGELSAAEKVEVEKHISTCSECLRELGEIKSAASLVKTLPRLKAPASIAQAVAREVAPAARVHSLAKYRKSIAWTFAAAAALLVIANVAYFAVAPSRSEGEGRMAAAPANVPPPSPKIETAKATYRDKELEKDGVGGEALRRARESDRNAEKGDAAPFAQENKKRADEKAGAFGAKADAPAESLGKLKEQAAQGENRGLAQQQPVAKAAADPAKPMPAPTAAKESGEALAKKEGGAPGAVAPAAPPAPAKSAPVPDARRELAMKQVDKAPSRNSADALQLEKQLADGAPPVLRYAVGTPQPAATRAKAQEILAKLGVAHQGGVQEGAQKDAAAAASPSLSVELTPTQFAELKRQLEADGGLHVLAVLPVEETESVQRGGKEAKAPAAGVGGGAGPRNDLDAKLAGAANDLKKPATSGTPNEERKNLDPASKPPDAKPAQAPEPASPKGLAAGKGEAETRRKYVILFLEPVVEKK